MSNLTSGDIRTLWDSEIRRDIVVGRVASAPPGVDEAG